MSAAAWKEIDDARRDEMLGVVPPLMFDKGFLVGEPQSYRRCTVTGRAFRPTFAAFIIHGGRMFEGPNLTVEEFRVFDVADLPMWFTTRSGQIEIQMTLRQARSATHPGPCDDDVRALSRVPEIAAQLATIDAKLLRRALREWGAWNEVELFDHAQNLQRILWLAAGELADQIPEAIHVVA